jgi:hypothetical protein
VVAEVLVAPETNCQVAVDGLAFDEVNLNCTSAPRLK